MIRYAILLLNMLGLFIYHTFIADGVTIEQSVPATMKPNNEYTIELTINKGNTGGFAKLQQELPAGLTATIIDAKGASFSFSGSAVKFIWTSLPSESEFKISYKVAVAATASTGEKALSGKFFYVLDNVKQSIEIPEAIFNIGDDVNEVAETATGTPVETEESPESTSTPEVTPKTETTPTEAAVAQKSPTSTNLNPSTLGGLTCKRKVTSFSKEEHTVELTFDRRDITGFGKLQENIPVGFVASPLQSAGASFSFTDQKVKFVWVSLPEDREFRIVYKLVGSSSSTVSIDGTISFIENEETKKITIAATKIIPESIASATTPEETTEIAETTETPDETSAVTTETATTDKTLTTPAIPSAQTNVNYKVQICALRKKPVEVTYFTIRFGFEKIDTELHEGWTKYTVGGFNEYKNARDNREEVRNKGVVTPFVTAYNSGQRITVQEALMISNQKWYK